MDGVARASSTRTRWPGSRMSSRRSAYTRWLAVKMTTSNFFATCSIKRCCTRRGGRGSAKSGQAAAPARVLCVGGHEREPARTSSSGRRRTFTVCVWLLNCTCAADADACGQSGGQAGVHLPVIGEHRLPRGAPGTRNRSPAGPPECCAPASRQDQAPAARRRAAASLECARHPTRPLSRCAVWRSLTSVFLGPPRRRRGSTATRWSAGGTQVDSGGSVEMNRYGSKSSSSSPSSSSGASGSPSPSSSPSSSASRAPASSYGAGTGEASLQAGAVVSACSTGEQPSAARGAADKLRGLARAGGAGGLQRGRQELRLTDSSAPPPTRTSAVLLLMKL